MEIREDKGERPIGFLRMNRVALNREEFSGFFPLGQDSMGVDILHQEPIQKFSSGWYHRRSGYDVEIELIKQAFFATVSIFEWFRHIKRPDDYDVVLYYKLRRAYMDYEVICAAYEPCPMKDSVAGPGEAE